MLPGAETGDGLPRAGSVQIASRRFLQNSLYRLPLSLSSLGLRYLEKSLCSQGNVCKALPPPACDVIAVGRILSGGRPRPAARKFRPEVGLGTVIVGGRRSEGGRSALFSTGHFGLTRRSLADRQLVIAGTVACGPLIATWKGLPQGIRRLIIGLADWQRR